MGRKLRFNGRSTYKLRRVHVPVETNADQYKTGKVQAEYPKERHDATERIAEQPFHGPRPRDFQRHHQERHLKQNTRALYTRMRVDVMYGDANISPSSGKIVFRKSQVSDGSVGRHHKQNEIYTFRSFYDCPDAPSQHVRRGQLRRFS